MPKMMNDDEDIIMMIEMRESIMWRKRRENCIINEYEEENYENNNERRRKCNWRKWYICMLICVMYVININKLMWTLREMNILNEKIEKNIRCVILIKYVNMIKRTM